MIGRHWRLIKRQFRGNAAGKIFEDWPPNNDTVGCRGIAASASGAGAGAGAGAGFISACLWFVQQSPSNASAHVWEIDMYLTIRRILTLALVFVVVNLLGFLLLALESSAQERLRANGNWLLAYKLLLMASLSFTVARFMIGFGVRLMYMFAILFLVYIPVFFGQSNNVDGFYLAWPIGFLVIDFFALVGMEGCSRRFMKGGVKCNTLKCANRKCVCRI